MTELSVFERRLAAGLEALAGPPRSIDAMSIAHAAVSQAPVRGSVFSRLAATAGMGAGVRGSRLGDLGAGGRTRPLVVLIAVALITALLFGAVAVGSGLLRRTSVVPPHPTPSPGLTIGAASWRTAGDLLEARYLHTATLLADGHVLVAGGRTATAVSNSLASAEIYDSIRRSWISASSMGGRRSAHSATLLADGRVLVAGGYDDFAALDSAEVFDPATDSWISTGSMVEARGYHTATLLADGRVLVTGGRSNNSSTGRALSSAELYDPRSGTWTATASMKRGRTFHTATLLPNGQVLVAGAGVDGGRVDVAATAELFDPNSGQWSSTSSMVAARAYHSATLLADGEVLVAGGYDSVAGTFQAGSGVALRSAERYDPSAGTWSGTASMAEARGFFTATLTADGRVLVVGGDSASYAPVGSGTSTYSTGRGLATAELFAPATAAWSTAPNEASGRELHAAVLLMDGRVLVIGGLSAGQTLRAAEMYGTK